MRSTTQLSPRRGRLFAPLTPEQFRIRHWGEQHRLVVHGPASRTRPIVDALGTLDLPSLLRQCGSIEAWYRTRRGLHRSVTVGARQARALYERGMTLYLLQVPALRPWADAMCAELGIDQGGEPNLFASRRGTVTRAHFDYGETLTVQLLGHKRWRTARNRQVENPLDVWVTGLPLSPSLAHAAADRLPDDLPGVDELIDMRPGSVLYLPAGQWHATETLEDSLSLEFSPPLKTWADVFLEGMRTALNRDRRWRERAFGVRGDAGGRAWAQRRLASLLRSVPRAAKELSVAALIGPDSPRRSNGHPPRRRYQRNPLVALRIERDNPDGSAVVCATSRSDGKWTQQTFNLPPLLLPVFKWIRARARPFSEADARRQAPRAAASRVATLLRLLSEVRFLLPK